ncbi:hypothetical protein QTH91_17140 [Variovorax dokdonensis]|uniref:Protein NO VEIN C-terminal domain-containing protein n=1 Tax=Variovorax dokdonensis TaxID=344883 RepID=A0ABT7NEH6_9BURK|nr:hypothetical protein [Variovorax dokdonensis]MDM0046220.1 hypothetical protein [Variovorax dokdonensis]
MESEVDPKVLAVIEEERLSGPPLTPVEVLSKLGVLEARSKPFESAWLATGDSVVAAIWAEYVNVAANGQWYIVESLNAEVRADGRERNATQAQRAEFRLAQLKRAFEAGQGFRAVLQTNRLGIVEAESNRSAKISIRVRDDEEWHVASWSEELQLAVLVRGARGWQPTVDELKSARRSHALPGGAAADGDAAQGASAQDVDEAAKGYIIRHFSSYGYQAEDVSSQALGYDVEVKDKKGGLLLRVCVRGASVGVQTRKLSPQEQASAKGEKLWRLFVVADALTGAAKHKIYKADEVAQVLPDA